MRRRRLYCIVRHLFSTIFKKLIKLKSRVKTQTLYILFRSASGQTCRFVPQNFLNRKKFSNN